MTLLACLILSCSHQQARAASPVPPLVVAVTNDGLVCTVVIPNAADGQRLRIVEILPQIEFQLSGKTLPLWEGSVPPQSGNGHTIAVARLDGERDRLFSKFQIQDAATSQPLGEPQWVTDFTHLKVRDDALPFAVNKKGLTCVVDVEDAALLGATQANFNLYLTGFVDLSDPNPEFFRVVDGQKIGFNKSMVNRWDHQLQAYRAHGIRATAILLNGIRRGDSAAKNPMIHPSTDLEHAPSGLGAFNVVTAEGLRCYRAVLDFLIDRYTQPGGPHGTLSGMVIGNELQSHWVWYNQGRTPAADVLRDYHVAVRVADLVARSFRADFPIYLSFDHHWQAAGTKDPLQGTSGRYIMETMNGWSQREGNFPWQVAFHPYPQSLFEPVFWHDSTAAMSFDSPRITFNNLEVLPAFLAQESFLYHGQPRGIALTEQGFHCPARPDGEDAQAAAYAYAYHKIELMPTVDRFLYHRHQDANEGGLHLGLREEGIDRKNPASRLGRARRIWEVFQAAETPRWEDTTHFALAKTGLANWSDVRLAAVTATSAQAREALAKPVYDFCENIGAAHTDNTLAYRGTSVIKAAGWMVPAILQHPNLNGESHAVFTVPLPALAAGKRLVLAFGTAFGASTNDGAKFRVSVDGKEVFDQKQTSTEYQPREIDLSKWAGHGTRVEFSVDPLGNNAFDESLWAEPRVELR